MSVSCAALMCHAPIVIPRLGGVRAAACQVTTRAMQAVAEQVLVHAPDVLVIVSPHAARAHGAWGVCTDRALRGDLSRFGAPEIALTLAGAPNAARSITDEAARAGLRCTSLPGSPLDHGAFVPLHFLHSAGWRGPTLLIALPPPGSGSEAAMGRVIRDTARALEERWIVIASGDMSHRLRPDAPAGYHPRAREFDAALRRALEASDLRAAVSVDVTLRQVAAEDVIDSCTVAAGAVDFDATGCRVFAYEGPFGVGYLEAILHEAADVHGSRRSVTAHTDDAPPRALLAIARQALSAAIEGHAAPAVQLDSQWRAPRGVFVTLRTLAGELRGCIGHLDPVCADLGEEVARCAVAAATRDPRFAPVRRDELADLRLELSLLSPLERVHDATALDCKRYGVVVSHGQRRGVLLPDIDGIESTAQQLEVARHKAGIAQDAAITIERFRVQKLRE